MTNPVTKLTKNGNNLIDKQERVYYSMPMDEKTPTNASQDVSTEKVDRETLFIDLLHQYQSPVRAAREAGYSASYSKNIINRKLSDPKFISRLKEQYKGRKAASLYQVDFIEAKALKEYQDDPKLAIKSPGLLKDIKTAAGIQQEEAPKQQYINIKNLQALSLHILNNPPEDKMIEGEAETID